MHLAWQTLKEKYPDRNLYTVDTKGITICSYAIALEIGELAKKGASANEILDWAKLKWTSLPSIFMRMT